VVTEDIVLCDAELKVQDVEELALDTAHIPFAEDPGTERPVDVL